MLSLNKKNVMVTGGAGFIGSHLVDALIKENPANLIVVDNMFLGRKENLDQAFDHCPSLALIKQDASQYDPVKSIIRQYGMRIEQLPVKTISDFELTQKNVFSTVKLRQLGVQFGELTPNQTSQLEHLLKTHTSWTDEHS